MCFGCSKEPSHWNDSFEYPQHMFWMRNKENNFPIRTSIRRLVLLSLCCSLINRNCLSQSMEFRDVHGESTLMTIRWRYITWRLRDKNNFNTITSVFAAAFRGGGVRCHQKATVSNYEFGVVLGPCSWLQSKKIVGEYDQEIPQSQTADKPTVPRERATQQWRDTRKTNVTN